MIFAIKFAAIAVASYLLGAIPFGLILSKKLANVDITRCGSGNIGCTNVFRVLGAKLGLMTMVLDVGKAALAVGLSMLIIGSDPLTVAGFDIHVQAAQILAALMAMVGHNWSVYIKFKGGKGVATFMGGLLVINWVVAVLAFLVGLAVALITRYVSLGSILASVVAFCIFVAFAALAFINPIFLLYGLAAAALIIYQHRTNIMRLQAGTENKLGDKSARIK